MPDVVLPEFDFHDFRVTTGFALERAKIVVWFVSRFNAGKHRERPTPGTGRAIESDRIDFVWLARTHGENSLICLLARVSGWKANVGSPGER